MRNSHICHHLIALICQNHELTSASCKLALLPTGAPAVCLRGQLLALVRSRDYQWNAASLTLKGRSSRCFTSVMGHTRATTLSLGTISSPLVSHHQTLKETVFFFCFIKLNELQKHIHSKTGTSIY